MRIAFVLFALSKIRQLFALYSYTKSAIKDHQVTVQEWDEISRLVKQVLDIQGIV